MRRASITNFVLLWFLLLPGLGAQGQEYVKIYYLHESGGTPGQSAVPILKG